ncbi:MAG: Rhodanese-related sulfurtransferase [Francisellaceae bacterium]|nr:Rhodanese-related sulfurtransferase [Francisellaceae bacterium]
MAEFINFVSQHWLLSSVFFILLFVFLINEARTQTNDDTKINPSQLVQLMNRQNAVIIDIRGASHFNEGHILGALNIPIEELSSKQPLIKQKYNNKPLVLVCALGQSVIKAQKDLKVAGITSQYLEGGIAGWRSANLPLTKK